MTDAIVIGGGIVGATTALALAREKFSVVLIDSQHPVTAFDPQHYGLRVSAITPASVNIFRALDVWGGMVARRISPFGEMRVWDAAGRGALHFNAAESGVDVLGYIVENDVMTAALYDALRATPNVRIHTGCAPSSLVIDDRAAHLNTSGEIQFSANVVIGADGRDSWVREQVGLPYRAVSYAQSAVVANIATEKPHRNTAWQRFTHEGPVAMLPLANGQSSLVWSVPTARAEQLIALSDSGFLRELHVAFGDELGALTHTSPRAAFPLQRAHAEAYVNERVALVGDAAHSMHPLAGQGVNMGLLDAATLYEVLLDARAAQRDPGDRTVLRRYERQRKGHNALMQWSVDGLGRLFTASGVGVVWARNAGLRAVQNTPLVKEFFSTQARGFGADTPTLARG